MASKIVRGHCIALLVWAFAVPVCWVAAGTAASAMQQEKKADKGKAGEEQPVVAGVLVDKAGKPVQGTTISLLMVTSERKVLPFALFTPECKTDAQGRFVLKVPRSALAPEGQQVVGFTVGIERWSEKERKTKVKALKIRTAEGESIARIALEPKAKKTDLGKIVLE